MKLPNDPRPDGFSPCSSRRPLAASRSIAGPAQNRKRKRAARCSLLILLTLSICAAADRPTIPWEKNHLKIGQALYRENCVVCHEIDSPDSKKLGPSFYQLFRRDKMPLSNMKPDRAYIKVRVKFGGTVMPAFRKWLTDKEIDTLIDYMASR